MTDLGVRYLIGMNSTAEESVKDQKPGCLKLEVVDLTDLDRLSLHTITLLLINLTSLKVLEHNHLHEALWMMDKTGMDSRQENLLITLYSFHFIDISYF